MQRGGPEKIGDRPSQTDAPPPVPLKNDSSLTEKARSFFFGGGYMCPSTQAIGEKHYQTEVIVCVSGIGAYADNLTDTDNQLLILPLEPQLLDSRSS